MRRVSIKVEDSSDGPVTVGDRTVAISQTVTMDVEGGLTISPADVPEPTGPVPGAAPMDVFDPGNRPNGLMTAAIAPKLPKSGGETAQVEEDGRVVERQVAELGRATQAGGPDSKDGLTPGPQPEPVTGPRPGPGAATGDVDREGRPVAAEAPQRGRPRSQARTAATTAAKKSGKKGAARR